MNLDKKKPSIATRSLEAVGPKALASAHEVAAAYAKLTPPCARLLHQGQSDVIKSLKQNTRTPRPAAGPKVFSTACAMVKSLANAKNLVKSLASAKTWSSLPRVLKLGQVSCKC